MVFVLLLLDGLVDSLVAAEAYSLYGDSFGSEVVRALLTEVTYSVGDGVADMMADRLRTTGHDLCAFSRAMQNQ